MGAESRDLDHKQALKVIIISTQRLGITDPLSDKMQVLTKTGSLSISLDTFSLMLFTLVRGNFFQLFSRSLAGSHMLACLCSDVPQ